MSQCQLSLNPNKHCLKILQETLLNSASKDFLPFMVGQSHDSFTLLSVKDLMLFQHGQQAIQVLCTGYRQWHSKAKLGVKQHVLCPSVSGKLKSAKMLKC
jgi:hypothetical protein